MSNPGHAVPREPMLERLGLGTSSYVELARRLALVAVIAAVLCAASFALVESIATTNNARRNRRERWSTPELARAPSEILIQLAIIGVAALAGRKVLRLRL